MSIAGRPNCSGIRSLERRPEPGREVVHHRNKENPMKTIIVIAVTFAIALGIASTASAGENWSANQEGNSYLMTTSKVASIRATVRQLDIGFLCEDGDANPLRIILMGRDMYGDGQLTYLMQVDDGPMLEPFMPSGEHGGVLVGNSEVRTLVDRLKRGNKLLIGARDESNEVSVFKLSLAGFTRALNESIPQRCLK